MVSEPSLTLPYDVFTQTPLVTNLYVANVFASSR